MTFPPEQQPDPQDPNPLAGVPLENIINMAQVQHDTYVAYVNAGFTPVQAMQLLIALIANGQ